MFENDKMASDLANSKGEMYKRKLQRAYQVPGLCPDPGQQACS
jgi:hypothetical protein